MFKDKVKVTVVALVMVLLMVLSITTDLFVGLADIFRAKAEEATPTDAIFEYVYDNKGNLISKEADFDAESQTIYIDKPNQTGDRTVMFLSILAGMLGLGVVTLFVTRRKKK